MTLSNDSPNGVKSHSKPWTETPLVYSTALSKKTGFHVHLKLENLQPSGSFKSRGVGNFLVQHLLSAASSSTPGSPSSTHFYSSSGGNAGLACVCAAVELNSAATVVVPMSTSAYMIGKIHEAGAKDVIQHGKSWSEANAFLNDTILPQARGRGENAVYVPPFDAPEVWDGNATMINEISEQLYHARPESRGRPDLVICSVGGGGLINGIMQGLDQCGMGDVSVLAVETDGAHSLAASLQEGKLVTLPNITSIATSLGATTVSTRTFEYAQRKTFKSLVLQDREAVMGCVDFAENHRILVEPACGVALAAGVDKRTRALFPHLNEHSNVVVIVCGGSHVSLELLDKYQREYL